MFITFEEMPERARVWIYQANRKLTQDECLLTEQVARAFTNQWSAHGQPLKSSYKLLYNQFLILSVDEGHHAASGCSIDDSVHLIQNLQKEIGVDFFDRTKVAFISDGEVFVQPLSGLKEKVKEGLIQKETQTFNNLVANVGEFNRDWLVPAGESWLKRYFN